LAERNYLDIVKLRSLPVSRPAVAGTAVTQSSLGTARQSPRDASSGGLRQGETARNGCFPATLSLLW